MAEAKEKDKFWLYIGGLIAVVIVLVFIMKGRETEHLESGSVAASNAEVDAALAARRAATKNTATEEN